MTAKSGALVVCILLAGASVGMAAEHTVPFVPSASDTVRQGFVRVTQPVARSGLRNLGTQRRRNGLGRDPVVPSNPWPEESALPAILAAVVAFRGGIVSCFLHGHGDRSPYDDGDDDESPSRDFVQFLRGQLSNVSRAGDLRCGSVAKLHSTHVHSPLYLNPIDRGLQAHGAGITLHIRAARINNKSRHVVS